MKLIRTHPKIWTRVNSAKAELEPLLDKDLILPYGARTKLMNAHKALQEAQNMSVNPFKKKEDKK